MPVPVPVFWVGRCRGECRGQRGQAAGSSCNFSRLKSCLYYSRGPMLPGMLDDGLRSLIALHGVGETRSRGILIVDDERPNLTVLRNFLEAGYRVYEAQSGNEALEIAKATALDVIIADQRMPEMTGVELLEKLRDFKPDVAGIILTGFTDPPALISAINRARVFRFLKKPWQPDDILEAVRQASEHVYQTRAIQRLVALLAKRTDELDASLVQIRRTQSHLLHLERLGTMG